MREQINNLAPLQGMLGHIYHVRDQVDQRAVSEKKNEATATATRKLYQRFLFYRNFVAASKPLVIPEGKTDSIYLRSAIERLTAYHPRLGVIEDGKFKHLVKFMNFSRSIHDVLQLGNGVGDLQYFIRKYSKMLKGFRHRPLAHPVIVLVDNDSGGDQLFKDVKNLISEELSLKSKSNFYRICDNLYLVKTPEIGESGSSCIEDLFKKDLLSAKVDGKIFDPSKKHDEAGKYGKQIFAEKVVRSRKSEIDFSDFAPLLDRIVAVMDDYANRQFR